MHNSTENPLPIQAGVKIIALLNKNWIKKYINETKKKRGKNKLVKEDGCRQITALSREKGSFIVIARCFMHAGAAGHCIQRTGKCATVHIISYKIYCITVSFFFYCLCIFAEIEWVSASHKSSMCLPGYHFFTELIYVVFGTVSVFFSARFPNTTVLCDKFPFLPIFEISFYRIWFSC